MSVAYLCPKCGAEISKSRSKNFFWCEVCLVIKCMEWHARFVLKDKEPERHKAYDDGYGE